MSHSIGIPGFVNERKQDIQELSGLKRAASTGNVERNKRDRISMYRTRSYLPYRMSRSVKQRHKRGPALFSTVSVKPKVLYRRHKRLPRLLQNTFATPEPVTTLPTIDKKVKNKKQKVKATDKLTLTSSAAETSLQIKSLPANLRLNTHLWHVKRFKVPAQDGWYTPLKHISRGLKAVDELYDKCVIQDVSNYTAHVSSSSNEIGSTRVSGSIDEVNALFGLFTDPLESLVYTEDDEEPALTEAFEKEVVFHAKKKFPADCIGPVMLLVTPGVSKDQSRTIQVQVSCHPSIASVVHQSLCGASNENTSVDNDEDASESRCTTELTRAYCNRIRLRGPESSVALLSILHAPVDSSVNSTSDSVSSASNAENNAKISFLHTALGVRDLSKHFEDGDVIALNVSDPRLHPTTTSSDSKGIKLDAPKLPQKEVVAVLKARPALLAAESALFDHRTRFLFESEHAFNEAKHNNKVRKWEALFKTTTPFGAESAATTTSGTTATASSSTASGKVVPSTTLPVLLIRKVTPFRHFRTRKHRLSGWDIVLPAVWGSLVFRHLQLRGGAAAVGCEEMDHLLAKSGIPTFPRDYPDTDAGRAYWNAYQENERSINEKRPPLKQIVSHNLQALLGAVSNPAATRTSAENVDLSSTLVVRGENYLKDFHPPAFESLDKSAVEDASRQLNAPSSVNWTSSHIPRLPALPSLMFLQVVLIPSSRGLILDLAELVCPSQEDVAQFVRHKIHTQNKRNAARAASQDQPEAHIAVKGVYTRDASKPSAAVAATNAVEEDLSKEWEGVRLARLSRPAAAPGDASKATVTPQQGDATSSDSTTKVPEKKDGKKKKNTPHAAEVEYDIGTSQGRKVIGTVTTGQKEHLNNTHFALGLCNVNALNEMFSASFGRHLHPQAHFLVLYRNARSDHLRPAIFQIV